MIFNPHASFGRARRLLPSVRAALERFAEVDLQLTRFAGDATEQVAAADLAGYDGLLAAGGDGTLFEVLNGLYRHAPDRRPPLGLVPVGTGNAFARDLGLMPGDWEKGPLETGGRGLRRTDWFRRNRLNRRGPTLSFPQHHWCRTAGGRHARR